MKRTATALTFALRLGLAAAVPLAVGASTSGCADENDPATWVKRLDDPAQRAASIKRLGQFYEDTFSKVSKKRDDPELKKLLDVIVDPMTKTYTAGGLDDKTRKELMKELGDMRDPRTAPAFAKAFNEYELGKNDEDVKFAAEAVSVMAKEGSKFDQALVDALWGCFIKYKPSKTNSIQGTTALHDAIVNVKHESYGPKAVEAIGKAVTLDDGASEQGTKKVNDQLEFWQTTAIQVISALKYKPAAKALVTVMMTQNKLGLALLAQKALLSMPAEAVPLLGAALNQTDPAFAPLAAEWGTNKDNPKGYVPVMMNVLAYTSLPAARDAIYTAIPGLDTDTNRAGAAQSLIWFPADQKLVDTFKGVYAKLPPIADKGDDDTGLERAQLLQVSSEFFTPSLLPWALSESAGAKGTHMLSAKVGAIQASIKLMQPDQKKAVGDALTALEKSELNKQEKEAVANVRAVYDYAGAVVDKCKTDAACYAAVLDEAVDPKPNANWKHIKAAAMAGILGNDDTRKALVTKLPKVKNPGARLGIAVAINHLAPNGDAASAGALEKIVAEDTEKKDSEALKGDDALVKVSLMLRARAGK